MLDIPKILGSHSAKGYNTLENSNLSNLMLRVLYYVNFAEHTVYGTQINQENLVSTCPNLKNIFSPTKSIIACQMQIDDVAYFTRPVSYEIM